MPSYNTGPELLVRTVRGALKHWQPVWVVIDGSTDGSAEALQNLGEPDERLRVFVLQQNRGKGAAVLHGLEQANKEGISHVLTMDADDQHPANWIEKMTRISKENPEALVLGDPIFDESAPAIRVNGRKLSNWWANVETLWWGIGDSLFGFRVYPVKNLLEAMHSTRWARRFDFDAEAAIRICWQGVPAINVAVPVRYLRPDEGGVSQFRYLRDNILLVWMYSRMFFGEFLFRIPGLMAMKRERSSRSQPTVS